MENVVLTSSCCVSPPYNASIHLPLQNSVKQGHCAASECESLVFVELAVVAWREAGIHSAARLPLLLSAQGPVVLIQLRLARLAWHHEVNQPPYLSTWRSPPSLPPRPRVHNFRFLGRFALKPQCHKTTTTTALLLRRMLLLSA